MSSPEFTGHPAPASLAAGESRTVVIRARRRWNHTGILVAPGEAYRLSAEGSWSDLGIRCGPEGYPTSRAPAVSRWLLQRFEAHRRMPRADWFCLIVAIGQDLTTALPVGAGIDRWRPRTGGEVLCFANDVALAYWNNWGSVRFTLARIA